VQKNVTGFIFVICCCVFVRPRLREITSRVSTPLAKSWIFFLKIPGPGKSRKNILKNHAFFIGSNGKQTALL